MENIKIEVVIGSWLAYNEVNERALGSNWLNLEDFETLEDLIEELKNEGFTDEELEETFIQDMDSEIVFENCDYISVERLREIWETLNSVSDSDLVIALSEIFTLSELINIIENESIEDYYLSGSETASDYAEEIVEDCYNLDNMGNLKYYIDYEAMGRDMVLNGEIYETSKGVVVCA